VLAGNASLLCFRFAADAPGVFDAADGALLSAGAAEDDPWRALCDYIGRLVWRRRAGWESHQGRRQNGTEIDAALEPLFAVPVRDGLLLHLVDGAGVPSQAVNGLAEAVVGRDAAERHVMSWTDKPDFGSVPQMRSPAPFVPAEAEAAPAPRMGEHTESTASELEFSQEEFHLVQSHGAV